MEIEMSKRCLLMSCPQNDAGMYRLLHSQYWSHAISTDSRDEEVVKKTSISRLARKMA